MKNNDGEIVATGLSPPIMITDDHKSSKHPSMTGGRKRMRVDLDEGTDIPLPLFKEQTTSPPTPSYEVSNFLTGAEEVGGDEKGLVTRHDDGEGEGRVDLSPVQAVLAQSGLIFVAGQVVGEEAVSSSEPVPVITRIIPGEGPVSGGVEITVLGSGFHGMLGGFSVLFFSPFQNFVEKKKHTLSLIFLIFFCLLRPDGLTVHFGDTPAIPTHYWSETTLVCVLPPSLVAGVVPVVVKQVDGTGREGGGGGGSTFLYKDDSDRALMELALQVLGLRMTGRVEDARQVGFSPFFCLPLGFWRGFLLSVSSFWCVYFNG